jgi:hypothetical protein
MATIVTGNGATAPDAATVAYIEQTMLDMLYRLEARILEQVAEKILDAETSIISELNRQCGGAIEELEGRVEQRLQAMEQRIARIGDAVSAALAEMNETDEEEGEPDA